jgi:hypothetical protein
MEITSTLVVLYDGFKLASSIQQIATFISEEERLRIILKTIGEQEYSAAQKSLEDARQSRNPRREMESALTIFRLALERDLPTDTKMVVALTVCGIYRAFDERILTAKFLDLANRYFNEKINSDNTVENVKLAGKVIGGAEEAGKLVMKSMLRSRLGLFAGLVDKKLEEGEMKSGASYEKRTHQAEELAAICESAIKKEKEAFAHLYEFLSK